MQHARADVLGRLLVVQQALDALPDEIRLGEFVRQALMTVPGVRDVLMYIRGSMIPSNAEFDEICEQYERTWRTSSSPDFSMLSDQPGVHYFPARTASHLFGLLIVHVADEVLLRPYLDFLNNIANAIGMVLETRLYQSQLSQANEELRKARDELEIRVAERTQELVYLATHDQLTGLANRALLVDRLQNAISFGKRYRRTVAVMYLDLDSFTYVNTGLGTVLGDELLKEMARRLSSIVRENDTVARVGSDEFVILLTDLENTEGSSARLMAILAAVRKPMNLAGKEIMVTGSIGACFYPFDGDDYEILLQRANAAMRRAKASGRDCLHFFAADRDLALAERMELEMELRQAIPRGELVMHYQPKLELRTGKIVGTEALVRWRHPRRNLMFPTSFIPIAEESTLIVALGEWTLLQACLQARIWQEARIDGAAVAVNLSARQFRDNHIVGTVRKVLQDTGLEPWRLEMEITEGSIMHDIDQVIALMTELKQLGVTISIDDFGTGYSSMSYLRSFPADKLKIDQTFVHDIETTANAAAVARAVIAFAKSLHLKVVAEGVETVGQAVFLLENGCDEIQGFLVARPQPVEELQELLSRPFPLPWTS